MNGQEDKRAVAIQTKPLGKLLRYIRGGTIWDLVFEYGVVPCDHRMAMHFLDAASEDITTTYELDEDGTIFKTKHNESGAT